MDAELIERLESHMGKQHVQILLTDCRLAATQGTADNARIAELESERDHYAGLYAERAGQLATAERDTLERAAVIVAELQAVRNGISGTTEWCEAQSVAFDEAIRIATAIERKFHAK